jgi:hypothetical protein
LIFENHLVSGGSMRVRTIAILALVAPITALAGQSSGSSGSDMSIGVRFGTLGFGPEIAKLITPHIGLRIGADFFSLTHTFNQSELTIDGKIKMKAFTGLLDLFPGNRGSFHVTAGVISNPVEITGTGVPSSSGFTINKHPYSQSDVGTLSGSANWPSASPYVGFGFGTPAGKHSGIRFVFDVGVGIGKPTVLISATGSATNSALATDLAAQQDTIQKTANKLPVYPAISFGLVFRF